MRNATTTQIIALPQARRPRASSCGAALALGLLATLAACGDGEGDDKDVITLPTDSGGSELGWQFGDDSGAGSDGAGPLDAGDGADADVSAGDATSDAAGDGDISVDTGGVADAAIADAIGADATTAPITSCAGYCGIFLDANACHCNHACLGSGSCCGGDGPYLAVCACNGDGDCDDGNPCTIDSCQNKGGQKLCMNLPFAGCCGADSECKGGDGVCNIATCLEGTCTLLPKACDDGVDCTVDSCDPADGSCQHVLPKTACQIDGACWSAGDPKPGSGGCQSCEPSVDAKAWTAKPGKCLIDGACVASGAKASSSNAECRVCLPEKAKDAWSVTSDSCYIDGTCYPDGAVSLGGSCEVCDPAQSQLSWSGKAGTCAIDGACYDAGAKPAGVSCATCAPSSSTAAWQVDADQCFIDGACYAKGASKAGSGGCEVCEPEKSATTWTGKLGVACDDGDPCTINDACTSALVCKGKASGVTCCKSDAECADQVQPGDCQDAICKGDGTCAIAQKANCCSSGVCCDPKTKTIMSKGTLCQPDPKMTQYKCENNDIYRREGGVGCNGTSQSGCVVGDSAGEWELLTTCPSGKTCKPSSPYSKPFCT